MCRSLAASIPTTAESVCSRRFSRSCGVITQGTVNAQRSTRTELDNRLRDDDKAFVIKLNELTARLSELRAVEITVSGPLAQSKIEWKLVSHQHALLHRVVALVDDADCRRQSRLTVRP